MRSIGIEPRSGRELVGNIGDSITNVSSFVVVIVVDVARGPARGPALANVVVVAVAAAADVSHGCNVGR